MPDGTIGQQRLFRLHLATRTINRLRRLSRPREYHTVGRHDNDAVTLTAYIERICGMIGVSVTFRSETSSTSKPCGRSLRLHAYPRYSLRPAGRFLFNRCSRRNFANVLRKSVLLLGVYINERSRIDFVGPLFERALEDQYGRKRRSRRRSNHSASAGSIRNEPGNASTIQYGLTLDKERSCVLSSCLSARVHDCSLRGFIRRGINPLICRIASSKCFFSRPVRLRIDRYVTTLEL